jgi:integrase
MTATLYKGDNRKNYTVLLRFKDVRTGKKCQKWVSTDIPIKGDNKRKAEARCREILTEHEKQGVVINNDIMFTVFIKEWLENLKPSINIVTYDGYKLIIDNQIIPFFEPLGLRVKDVLPLHIQMYVVHKIETASPNTARSHLWNLSKCLDSAVKQQIITVNPVKLIDKPQKVKYTGAKFYNEQQIDKLLKVFKGDLLEGVILFAVYFGLRRSEIMGLRWRSVDFVNKTVTIENTVVQTANKIYYKASTKTKSSYRTLPMSDIIIKMLERIKAEQEQHKALQPNDYIDEGYIFTNIDGSIIRPNYVTKHFKDVLAKNKMSPIRLHDLRHSAASYLIHLGFNMKEIQVWLGHGDIGTTMNLYTHIDLAAKRNIADSLNEKFMKFG